MKKIVSFIIITFALLILSNVESKASCPTDYTSQTMTINVGGCQYYVDVCVLCPSPTSHYPDEGGIIVNSFIKVPTNPPCINGMSDNDVIDYLYNYMHTGQFIWYFACLYDGRIPPCGGQGGESKIQYHVLWPNCWKIDHVPWYHVPYTGMVACEDDSFCRTWTTYCVNNGDLEPVQQWNLPEGPPPTCPLFTPPGVYQQCFRVPNPCYP